MNVTERLNAFDSAIQIFNPDLYIYPNMYVHCNRLYQQPRQIERCHRNAASYSVFYLAVILLWLKMHYISTDWASLMLHNILEHQTLMIMIEFRLISLYLVLPHAFYAYLRPCNPIYMQNLDWVDMGYLVTISRAEIGPISVSRWPRSGHYTILWANIVDCLCTTCCYLPIVHWMG